MTDLRRAWAVLLVAQFVALTILHLAFGWRVALLVPTLDMLAVSVLAARMAVDAALREIHAEREGDSTAR